MSGQAQAGAVTRTAIAAPDRTRRVGVRDDDSSVLWRLFAIVKKTGVRAQAKSRAKPRRDHASVDHDRPAQQSGGREREARCEVAGIIRSKLRRQWQGRNHGIKLTIRGRAIGAGRGHATPVWYRH